MTCHDSRTEGKLCPKITISSLSEEQMNRVRAYMDTLPNKPHAVKEGHFPDTYGNYIKVNANVVANVQPSTAKLYPISYNDVVFSIEPHGSARSYCPGVGIESKKAIKGLLSLLGNFLLENLPVHDRVI